MDRPIQLPDLFHRRWMLPVLAELHRGQGRKFVTLVYLTGASRKAITETLLALMKLGLVMRNPGYGHPLRPEYLLTTRAMQSGAAMVALYDLLARQDVVGSALKKWSLPVLMRIGQDRSGARFSMLRADLAAITDRALTLALKDLQGAGLITRLVLDSYPPTTLYQPTTAARPILAALDRLVGEFPNPPSGAENRRGAVGG